MYIESIQYSQTCSPTCSTFLALARTRTLVSSGSRVDKIEPQPIATGLGFTWLSTKNIGQVHILKSQLATESTIQNTYRTDF